ncbi:hypothetical protein BDP55DRAFT_629563 [Colletotrichum godetiae]|uniref:Protein kinase domain-containing protein n=1 Tax=Colletotrichum godetiae TaxID=1209918 RepID=A0AAJ0AQE1_9PEZI|nr:uncharacterized protein BDP55DRAFT_629563 [Colletotrichum godetiae]KAK1688454.1 hypothetical protein BDP55DRAFT_629563 [Colletotrichum godetiae]
MSRVYADSDYYCPGSILTLTKYTPVKPHGTSDYHPNPPPGPELRHFDPHRFILKDEQVQLEVLERFSMNPGPQVFRCKIIASPKYEDKDNREKVPDPQTQVVAKVFDHKLWQKYNGTPIDNIELNEGLLSRESWAYKHLYQKNLTGPPNITAQYYGTWAVKFSAGKTPEGPDQYKTVALILMEYIDGYSINDLCNRDEYGNLVPDDELPLEFHQSDTGRPVLLDINHDTRMEILRQLIHGTVEHMHEGVMDGDFAPRHVYITMRDGTGDLEKPRTVLFDLSRARLWSMTKYVQLPAEGIHCYELVPNPIHPSEVFSAPALSDFAGWFPQEWLNEAIEGDIREGRFRDWLIEAFGPVQEGPGYSIHQTVDRAIAQRDREEDLSKMKAAIIEGDFHVLPYPPFYPAVATLEIPRFGSLNISRE